MSQATPLPPTSNSQSPTPTPGSPFSPGIPLEAHQTLFGRKEAFGFVAGELKRFKSVNLVGERRMGKTSLLNHLLGRQEAFNPSAGQSSPLVLARLDLQGHVGDAERFYGKALCELIEALPAGARPPEIDEWRKRLRDQPKASAVEFENFLKSLKESSLRPVLLVDEFERVFDPGLKAGFPFPDFFDGLRSQITAGRVAIVLLTRDHLTGYFTRQSLTSTFPSYFQPYRIGELEESAAYDLLTQLSDCPLSDDQAREALDWAGRHPCGLQCAGAAWHQALLTGKSPQWAEQRYREIVEQLGFVNPAHHSIKTRTGLKYHVKGLRLGSKANKAVAWCETHWKFLLVVAVILLIAFKRVSFDELLQYLKTFLGGGKEK